MAEPGSLAELTALAEEFELPFAKVQGLLCLFQRLDSGGSGVVTGAELKVVVRCEGWWASCR